MKAMTAVFLSSGENIHSNGSALSAWIYKQVETISTWRKRARGRRQLAVLDAHQMKDIGITDAQRFVEVNKSFWEV